MPEESFAKSLFFGVVAEALIFPYPTLTRAESDVVLAKMDETRRLFVSGPSSVHNVEKAAESDTVAEGLKTLGAYGFNLPKAYDGGALSVTASTRLVQEIAAYDSCAAVSINAHQGLAARAIVSFGTDEQRATFLPPMANGERIGAFCLSELAAGSDAGGIKTRAEKRGDSWFLNGTKHYVVNGSRAGTFVVFARTSPSEDGAKPRLGAFLVDATNDGRVRRGSAVRTHGMPNLEVTDVTFDNVEVPASHLLDEPGRGFRIATDVLNYGRLGLSAICLGAMKKLVRASTERVQERKAFFRPIAEFALIKDKIAMMAAHTFAAESALYLATGLVDKATVDPSVECAMVKVIASESYFHIAHEAMQIMAGAGYVKPNFADAAVRDARFFLVYQGTNETLRCFIALSGMQAPGEKITEVSRALREPIKGFGLLGDFALRKAKSAFGRERIAAAHPLLSREANVVEEYSQLLARNVDMVLRRHEKNIVEMQFTQRRVADMATDLFALSACIARTTRGIERRGEEGSRREIDLLSIFASACAQRLAANAAAFDKNDDELRKSVADRAYADRGYPLDVV